MEGVDASFSSFLRAEEKDKNGVWGYPPARDRPSLCGAGGTLHEEGVARDVISLWIVRQSLANSAKKWQNLH